jgi:hypothetical protein
MSGTYNLNVMYYVIYIHIINRLRYIIYHISHNPEKSETDVSSLGSLSIRGFLFWSKSNAYQCNVLIHSEELEKFQCITWVSVSSCLVFQNSSNGMH